MGIEGRKAKHTLSSGPVTIASVHATSDATGGVTAIVVYYEASGRLNWCDVGELTLIDGDCAEPVKVEPKLCDKGHSLWSADGGCIECHRDLECSNCGAKNRDCVCCPF